MGFDRKQLKELMKSLYGFGGKRIEPVGVITLLVSFGTPQNSCTEYITFNVVDMHYPYNVIFWRGLLNSFKATRHSGYLCIKILATFRVISVFGTQKDAKSIEQGFTLGTRMCISYEKNQSHINNQHAPSKQKLQQNIRNPSKLMVNSWMFL